MLVGLAPRCSSPSRSSALSAVAVGYLLLLPYTIYRFSWLTRHPEAWDVPVRERRAVARAARSARRLGLRSPLRRRVAGGSAERGARGPPAATTPPRDRRRPGRPTTGASPSRHHRRGGLRLGLRAALTHACDGPAG